LNVLASPLRLVFTDRQLQMIADVFESWVDGYDDATNEVIRDRSLESPDQLLEAVDGMHDDYNVAMSILQTAREAVKERK
jgi:hypothetical protein